MAYIGVDSKFDLYFLIQFLGPPYSTTAFQKAVSKDGLRGFGGNAWKHLK